MGILRTDKISGLETPTPVTGSVYFDGTGDYLSIDLGTSGMSSDDFTIEYWAYSTGIANPPSQRGHFQISDTSGGLANTSGAGLALYANDTASEFYDYYPGASSTTAKNREFVWQHFAYVRSSGTIKIYVDGVEVASFSNSLDYTSYRYLAIGGFYSTTYVYKGYISNFRILRGTALYTSEFTPPVHELEVIGDTVLLCCNNSDSAGADGTGKTITVNGDAAGSTFSPGLTKDFTFGTEFNGVTTFDTQGYFVPPSGTTTERFPDFAGVDSTSARGVFIMGRTGPTSTVNVMDYITIATTGNAQDFGDSIVENNYGAGASSSTRGLSAGGDTINLIQYITISSAGDAKDFGDLTSARREIGGASNSTRGLFAGGNPGPTNLIDYVTITSMGNAFDFGDLTLARTNPGGLASPTRALFGGGYVSPARRNTIDYVTIATTGNALDFGDLTLIRETSNGGVSSATRGVWGGGWHPARNTIDYVTIASLGDAIDFGDLTSTTGFPGAVSSKIRGVWGGRAPATNTIQYVTIATTGDATDFGDLTLGRYGPTGVSNGHGGLG